MKPENNWSWLSKNGREVELKGNLKWLDWSENFEMVNEILLNWEERRNDIDWINNCNSLTYFIE